MNAFNSRSGHKLGGSSLPPARLRQEVRQSPQVLRHLLLKLLVSGLLHQIPDTILVLQMKGPALHVPSGHQQSGGGAHPLALQQPDGVGCPHKTVGAGDLLEGIGGSLLPQMVDKQQSDVVLVRQGFQGRHILVVGGIDSFPLVRHPHLLQGVNDHQPGVRVGCQEGFQLLFQALTDRVTGCLEVKSAWNRVLGELEQSALDAGICIFEAKVEDWTGLDFTAPEFAAFGQLQTQPKTEPALSRFTGPGQEG